MNFYEYNIHILSYIFIYCNSAIGLKNADLRTQESGVEDIVPCAVGLKLYAVVNNTSSLEDYEVELVPDQCCLQLDTGVDCDVLKAVGNCVEKIPRGSTKTLKIVAPILDPYERKGYCSAYIDSKSIHKRNAVTMRDAIKIHFDTRLENYKQLPAGVERCKRLDEDPLNHCREVNCETFYNGKKSYYHRVKKRCVKVPRCISDHGDIPNAVLDIISNQCVDDPISKDDIDYIKSLKHKNGRVSKDIVIIKKAKDGPINITEFPDKETIKGGKKQQATKDWYTNSVLCIIGKNKSGISFLFCIIMLQCGLICTMIYFIARRCLCKKGSKILEKKYFNYRQDASVTTPLIGVTTIETATTCQFTSESSHIEKKIQCYKACQKDNAKVSLSDDILSKCLNRRNWDRKQVKSDAVEVRNDHRNDSKTFDTLFMSTKKGEQKVNFENDIEKKVVKDDKKVKQIRSIETKETSKKTDPSLPEVKSVSDPFVSERELQCLTYKYKDSKPFVSSKPQSTGISEKEIRCHSYNYGMEAIDRLDSDSLKISSHSYSDVQSTSKQPQVYATALKEASYAASGRQASVQASFSNDSIDDYLSERGMLFLTGENISKYSFSDASLKSSVSSKTSKNNIVKHVLSYLKREKHGPSSDPGGKKPDEEVNLELIHMSKVTMYSSSNNGTECIKNISRVKDSRTSL